MPSSVPVPHLLSYMGLTLSASGLCVAKEHLSGPSMFGLTSSMVSLLRLDQKLANHHSNSLFIYCVISLKIPQHIANRTW